MSILTKTKLFIISLLISFLASSHASSNNVNNTTQLSERLLKDPIRVFQATKDNAKYIGNQLIVSFGVEDYEELIDKYDIIIQEQINATNYLIEFDADKYTLEEMLILLNQDIEIEYAEPNYILELKYSPTTEPFYEFLWGFNSPSYSINITSVWENTLGSDDIVVAIVDSGIDYNHPDLSPSMWINSGEIFGNGVDDDGNGYIDDYYGWNFHHNNNQVMDGYSHGTHVAGIVAAAVNGEGIVGVAPNVKLMALKISDDYGLVYLDSILSAIDYGIENGVKIFNFSFGGPSHYQSLSDAMANSDALFLCAAGNAGLNNDIYPMYPASYPHSNIISIAALDQTGNLASFSNYGINSVDIAAPGEDILSAIPLSLTPQGYYPYWFFDGTSMAAPYVAGLAAILWSENIDFSVAEIKGYILDNARPLGSLNTKIVTGGIIDAYQAYNALNLDDFDGGDGTIDDPYLISKVIQFNKIREDLSASYKLTSNLDFSYDTTNSKGLFYNNGKGWLPIGHNLTESSSYNGQAFTGNFDGAGYTISGLNISRPNEYFLGLFGKVEGSEGNHSFVKDLVLDMGSIVGRGYIGSLIGHGEYVDISNIGIDADIRATDDYVGGIVGYLVGNISESYNTAIIYASTKVGGIAGYLSGTMNDTFNLGQMKKQSSINISESGGIVGVLSGTISNIYYIGMSGQDDINFIVGSSNDSTINNAYYYNPFNYELDINGFELQQSEVFDESSYVGFDFDYIWEIDVNSKFPTLKNVYFEPLIDFDVANQITIDIKRDLCSDLIINNQPINNWRNNYLYSSNDENVATVDKNGRITPIGLGNTTVEVYSIELETTKSINIEVMLIRGDINNDGRVTITDLVKLSRYLAGLESINSNYLDNADVNNDGKVTITDLVKLSRYLAGLEEI
jgi:subtilisin family serine protease